MRIQIFEPDAPLAGIYCLRKRPHLAAVRLLRSPPRVERLLNGTCACIIYVLDHHTVEVEVVSEHDVAPGCDASPDRRS